MPQIVGAGGNGKEDDDKISGDDATKSTESPGVSKEDLEDEEARWNKLDDHDKRKEYKRARKILEVIKAE